MKEIDNKEGDQRKRKRKWRMRYSKEKKMVNRVEDWQRRRRWAMEKKIGNRESRSVRM